MKDIVWSPLYASLAFCLAFFGAGVIYGNNPHALLPALCWGIGAALMVEFWVNDTFKNLAVRSGLIPIYAGVAYVAIGLLLPAKYQQTVWGIGFWAAAALFVIVVGRSIWLSFTKK